MQRRNSIAAVALVLALLTTGLVIFLLRGGGVPHIRGPHIAPMQLTADQWDIVDLLSNPGQEILLFEYQLGDFDGIEVWVEIYHYGELVETGAGLHMFGFREMPVTGGQLAITIRQSHQNGIGAFQWTISTAGGSAQNSEPWLASEPYLGSVFGPMREPVALEDGQEIILYTALFSNTGTIATTMLLDLNARENPARIAQYTHVHMIVARFSN